MQVAQALAVLGRDRNRLAQAQAMRLGEAAHAGLALAFVGDQHDLGCRACAASSAKIWSSGGTPARASIRNSTTSALSTARSVEAAHARFEAVAAVFPAGGVEQREFEVAELRRPSRRRA